MGILNNIFSKIFPSAQATVGNATDAVKDQVGKVTNSVKDIFSPHSDQNQTNANQNQNQDQSNSANNAPISNVDVMSILDNLAKKFPEKLNWKTSIVDLLKLLGIDNSLDARKKLAKELNYTGSTDDTAAMNMWLIKEVMKKIAEKGGNVTHLFS
ncbi:MULTISPECIES: DUF3597 domain-containing protein [unclassified Gilliamella]|uniref:DUF3597 domain-containing protein n=1 Tax=unclassified Gilliamella TaxID=2685620 RepID=UPI001C6A0CB0|nr:MULTISPECIES: DUF3597 domain-containing protein [unclassified Gilliamella]MCX8601232.1 DUF3597 domain-containing protein [Gilliamella sp. B3722]MCX8607386.1 DUF3597 domain-containing protein [Gilliamella sp. B3771]MCX8610425.1 DUF3597 domain-containing protein [Gilliamella sp. B3891]MCX8612906.1 DUF3597 domain-containing protein [Gilliamella sp. B3773]MCX8614815.1 DUF3597 domain-containing protein [Gilliamella sp. B3770]